MRLAAQDKGLALRFEVSDVDGQRCLRGDPRRIQQLLLNLVANAVKFTPQGSVRVQAEIATVAGKPVLRGAVHDTGIGISKADLPRLFTAFEQADSSMSRRFGGSGLGLAIVRRLARLMGGDVQVTSSPGVGSVFRFELQLDWGAAAAADPGGRGTESAAQRLRTECPGLRVLLAEDEPTHQEILRTLLEMAGCRVDVVGDGAAATMAAQGLHYDVILMDMQMPLMDGLQAARRIRADGRCRQTPILATTANAFDEDLVACQEAGMDEHVVKPIHPEHLFERILRLVRSRPPQRQLGDDSR